jgi:hypothetical protein
MTQTPEKGSMHNKSAGEEKAGSILLSQASPDSELRSRIDPWDMVEEL